MSSEIAVLEVVVKPARSFKVLLKISCIKSLPIGLPCSPERIIIAPYRLRIITTCSSSLDFKNFCVVNSAKSLLKTCLAILRKVSAVLIALSPTIINCPPGLRAPSLPIPSKTLRNLETSFSISKS